MWKNRNVRGIFCCKPWKRDLETCGKFYQNIFWIYGMERYGLNMFRFCTWYWNFTLRKMRGVLDHLRNYQLSRILRFVERPSLYNLVKWTILVHNFFYMFIDFLYMFRATMCPSSGENTVPMRNPVFVILYLVCPAYQTVIHIELQIPGVA
jgi:hypothetical protein